VGFRYIADKKISLPSVAEKVKPQIGDMVKDIGKGKGKLYAAAFVASYSTIIICGFVGFLGMFFLWPPAPWLFGIYVIGMMFASPFFSYTVMTGTEGLFDSLEIFLEAVILTLIFFGPAKELFF
jgi:hypothetical protein